VKYFCFFFFFRARAVTILENFLTCCHRWGRKVYTSKAVRFLSGLYVRMEYKSYVNRHYRCVFVGCRIPVLHIALATKFCTVVSYICGFAGDGTCITVTRLAPGILRWQREFWKTCVLVFWSISWRRAVLYIEAMYFLVTIKLFYANREVGIKLFLTPTFRLLCESLWDVKLIEMACDIIR